MNTKLVNQLFTKAVVKWSTQDILEYAHAQGWDDVVVCGSGPMLTSPTEHESGWTLVPKDQDKSR